MEDLLGDADVVYDHDEQAPMYDTVEPPENAPSGIKLFGKESIDQEKFDRERQQRALQRLQNSKRKAKLTVKERYALAQAAPPIMSPRATATTTTLPVPGALTNMPTSKATIPKPYINLDPL